MTPLEKHLLRAQILQLAAECFAIGASGAVNAPQAYVDLKDESIRSIMNNLDVFLEANNQPNVSKPKITKIPAEA